MSRIAFSGQVRQREPRTKDPAYVRWLHERPCVACACKGYGARFGVETAHIKVGFPEAGWRAFGHGERAHDVRCVPLCAADHRTGPGAQHQNRGGDERDWWRRLGVYPPDFCLDLRAAYETGHSGEAVIRKAAAGGYPFPADA